MSERIEVWHAQMERGEVVIVHGWLINPRKGWWDVELDSGEVLKNERDAGWERSRNDALLLLIRACLGMLWDHKKKPNLRTIKKAAALLETQL